MIFSLDIVPQQFLVFYKYLLEFNHYVVHVKFEFTIRSNEIVVHPLFEFGDVISKPFLTK